MTPYRPLGSTGYDVHSMGFGCYRINDGNARHEEALRAYLDRGGNLIDTSANYGDGLSEVLVGRVIRDYARDKMVLVTKGGYIQGQNMDLAHEREFPETVRYANNLWHCIHPDFLETQIELSLKRLGQKYCDVYLLHNPEYYINYLAHTSPITDAALHEFYSRVKQAFIYLESQVAAGRIRYYGISSNNFGFHEKDRARTSVERCLGIARHISPDHHFCVVQLPMNLYESGGALFETNRGQSALQFCRGEQLGVLINRPLNAFFKQKLIRLADYRQPGTVRPAEAELNDILAPLRHAETEYQSQFDTSLFGREEEGLAAYLRTVALDLTSRDDWDGVMDHYIIPPLTIWLRNAHNSHQEKTGWGAWRDAFALTVNQALEGIERYLSSSSQALSDRVRQRLYECGYPESSHSLSRLALSLVAQLEGVSCVLVGMRTPPYVEDALFTPQMPPVDALRILRNFQDKILSQEGENDE